MNIQKAIDRIGGVTELLRRMRENRVIVTRQAIHLWLREGVVTPRRVLLIEKVTGVHRHYLNPKIYPEKPDDPLIANPPPDHPLRRSTDARL